MKLKTVGGLMFVVLTWGASFIFIKYGLLDMPPITFAAYRFLLASSILLSSLLITGKYKKVLKFTRREILSVAVLGVINVFFYYIFEFYGLQFVPAGQASVIINTDPIIVTILGAIFLGELITKRKVIGLILGYTGVTLVVIATNPTLSGGIWSIIILGAAFSWAIGSLLARKIAHNMDSYLMTAISVPFGTILLFAAAFITEGFVPISNISSLSWFSLIFLGIVSSVMTFFVWYEVLHDIEASTACITLLLVPIVTTILGVFLLFEFYTEISVLGIALTLIGVYLAQSQQNKKTAKPSIITSTESRTISPKSQILHKLVRRLILKI
ncbi:MAG: DMT family transporter [Candidatus Lokiarchaeia archaeon]